MNTTLEQRIQAFVQLSKVMESLSLNQGWPGFDCGLTEEEYESAQEVIISQVAYNGWFTEINTRRAIGEWANNLKRSSLEAWLKHYPIQDQPHKEETVAIICAGNIPMVGFHDILCVLLGGHKAMIKLSSDDARLIPLFLYLVMKWEPGLKPYILWAEGKLQNFDRIIATGSDNTSRYFHAYFDKYPNIIRHSRTSVAILNGQETEEELNGLAHDIFDYFGLGCRNVCKVFLPEGYDLNVLISALLPFQSVIQHNKYANNYDYNKAVWLLNQEDLLENGFMIFKQDQGWVAPTASLFYEYYSDLNQVTARIQGHQDHIQCVVGHGYTPFGQAQCPKLSDYPDGVDVMKFILS
jgi:hypothetical protein